MISWKTKKLAMKTTHNENIQYRYFNNNKQKQNHLKYSAMKYLTSKKVNNSNYKSNRQTKREKTKYFHLNVQEEDYIHSEIHNTLRCNLTMTRR